MELLHQRLGSHAKVGDQVELGAEDTPQYDPHERAEMFPILDEKL